MTKKHTYNPFNKPEKLAKLWQRFPILPTVERHFPTYYIHDHLGNTRITYRNLFECNGTGQGGTATQYLLQYLHDYFPYGKTLREWSPSSGNAKERYLTTQHQRGFEANFDYRGARLYDADASRFLSLDPLAAKYPALSDYVYVSNNPLIYIDPDRKKIEGVKYKNGEITGYSKAAEKNGTRTYVEAIKKMLKEKTTYKVRVTNKVLVLPYGGNKYGVTQADSYFPSAIIVISTSKVKNLNTLSKEELKNNVVAIDNDGVFKSISLKTKNIYENGGREGDPQYQKAFEDSGIIDFESNTDNHYKIEEELVHGLGAHEEVHVTSETNYNYAKEGDSYNQKMPAFQAELQARQDYRAENK